MTKYLFLPIGAKNEGTNQILQNLNTSPFIDPNYSRILNVGDDYYKQYVVAKDYENNPDALNVLKSTAEADASFLQQGHSDVHFGRVIISNLKDAPFALYNMEASPDYLNHIRELAEIDMRNISSAKDYPSSVNYQYIELYNNFHQDNPVYFSNNDITVTSSASMFVDYDATGGF